MNEAGATVEFPHDGSNRTASIMRDSATGRRRLELKRIDGSFFLRATVARAASGRADLTVHALPTADASHPTAQQVDEPTAPEVRPEATTMSAPREPTRAELEIHEPPHCPDAAWCTDCVSGRGLKSRCEAIEEAIDTHAMQMDYMFGKPNQAEEVHPVWNAIDNAGHQTPSVWCDSKGGSDTHQLEHLKRHVEPLGHSKGITQGDPENAAKDVAMRVAREIPNGTHDRLTAHRSDHKTSPERQRDRIHDKKVVPIGETVARKEPEPIATKFETAGGHGIYCGGSTKDDSHLADTPQGITTAKTARRLVEGEQRYDKQLLHATRGIPADPNAAHAAAPALDQQEPLAAPVAAEQAQRVLPGPLAPPAPGPEAAEMRPRPQGDQQRRDAEVEDLEHAPGPAGKRPRGRPVARVSLDPGAEEFTAGCSGCIGPSHRHPNRCYQSQGLEVPAAKERADEAEDGTSMNQEPVDQLPASGSVPPGRAAPSPSVQPAQEGMTEMTTDEAHGKRAAETESAEDPAPKERWVNAAKVAAIEAIGHPSGTQLEVPREFDPSTGLTHDASHGKDDGEPLELDAVREGITREIKVTDKLHDGGAVPRPRGEKARGAGWCQRRKADAVRSRSAVKQPRDEEAGDPHSGNPRWEATRALLAVALLLRHVTLTTDFSMASMHTPLGDEHEIYEEIPLERDMGRDYVWRLRRVRHGHRGAALRFQEFPESSIVDLGPTACVAEPTTHHHIEKGTRVAVHTDDPLASGPTELTVNGSFDEALACKPWSTDVDLGVLRDASRSPERVGEGRDGTDSEITGEGTEDGAIDKPWVCPCGCRPAEEAALEVPPGRLRCRCRNCRWTPQCWRLAEQGEQLCAHCVGELVPGGDRPPPSSFQNWMACWGSWWSLDGSQQLPRAYARHLRGQTGRRSDGQLPRDDRNDDSAESTSLNCEQTAVVVEGIEPNEKVEQMPDKVSIREVRTVKGPGTENAPDIGAEYLPRAVLEECRTMLGMTTVDSIGTVVAAALVTTHRVHMFLVVWMMTVAGVKGQVDEGMMAVVGVSGHCDHYGPKGWLLEARPFAHIAAAMVLGMAIGHMITRSTTAGTSVSASASASAGASDAAPPGAPASASASATAGTPAGAPEAASPCTVQPPTPPCARQRVQQVFHTDSRNTMVHVDSSCQQLRNRSKQLITRSVCSVCSGGLCMS
jgi:hypothetical protein